MMDLYLGIYITTKYKLYMSPRPNSINSCISLSYDRLSKVIKTRQKEVGLYLDR
jgi:hypothetical protein